MGDIGKYIGGLKDVPGIKQLYLSCDWAFDKAMGLAGKINPEIEVFLREHQGTVAFGLGVTTSYLTVRGFEKVFRKYDNLIPYFEKAGYVINVAIPVLIEFLNPGGLQGLAENNPIFMLGLVGLEGGSTLAAFQEGKNRKIRDLEKTIYGLEEDNYLNF